MRQRFIVEVRLRPYTGTWVGEGNDNIKVDKRWIGICDDLFQIQTLSFPRREDVDGKQKAGKEKIGGALAKTLAAPQEHKY